MDDYYELTEAPIVRHGFPSLKNVYGPWIDWLGIETIMLSKKLQSTSSATMFFPDLYLNNANQMIDILRMLICYYYSNYCLVKEKLVYLSPLKMSSALTSLHLRRFHYIVDFMFLTFLRTFISALRSHRALALENLALRHQLDVLGRNAKRPRLTNRDRALWVLISRLWDDWRKPLTIVQPDTVIRWKGFKLYWRWKSRPRWMGRRRVPREIHDLIRRMSRANPLWGAPRIHGELLKLGIKLSQATVPKYMVRHRKPPSQSWRVFLKNHAKDIVSVDFFTVPTETFRVLFVFLVLSNERRKVIHFNVTESPTAAWTGQQIVEASPWDTAPKYLLRDREGLANRLIEPGEEVGRRDGEVLCRERLGGMLRYYYRKAA